MGYPAAGARRVWGKLRGNSPGASAPSPDFEYSSPAARRQTASGAPRKPGRRSRRPAASAPRHRRAKSPPLKRYLSPKAFLSNNPLRLMECFGVNRDYLVVATDLHNPGGVRVDLTGLQRDVGADDD